MSEVGARWPVLPKLDTGFEKLWFLIVFLLTYLKECLDLYKGPLSLLVSCTYLSGKTDEEFSHGLYLRNLCWGQYCHMDTASPKSHIGFAFLFSFLFFLRHTKPKG